MFKTKRSPVLAVLPALFICALTASLAPGQTNQPVNNSPDKAAVEVVADKAAADKAAADQATADKAAVDMAAADKAKLAPFVPARGVYKFGRTPVAEGSSGGANDPAFQAGMNDIIVVKVRNLKKLLDEAKCKTESGDQKPNCTKHEIVLFLDGREIKALTPESGAPIAEEETLRFHIQRSPESDEAWADLLGAPPIFSPSARGGTLFILPVKVSVGLDNGHAIPSEVTQFSFIRVREWYFWFALSGLIALLIAVVVLARKTNLLRDDGVPIGENRRGQQTDQLAYSLGRCQMAFWFFLVITSFCFIFVITWQFNTVTEEALALMGISAADCFGSCDRQCSQGGAVARNLT